MKKQILRYVEGKDITQANAHSAKFLFRFNAIEIGDGVESVLEPDFHVIGAVSDLVISEFQLRGDDIKDAALSCVVSCLKTEPHVEAVVDKEYMLRTDHTEGSFPSMEFESEFPIQWDNK